MRFSLSSTALSSSLSSLSRVINSKNTMQILDCFLFSSLNTFNNIVLYLNDTIIIANRI